VFGACRAHPFVQEGTLTLRELELGVLTFFLLALAPPPGQLETAATTAIEAPAGVTVIADAATRLQIAQNGITFTLSSHGGDAKSLGLAGYVDLNSAPADGLRLGRLGEYATTGTTMDNDVLSVSVGSFGAPISQGGDKSIDSFLTVVLAQYN
jgi:hypothetical protein